MRTTAVSYVILGALRGGPKSGYDIKQLVDNATRFFWAASYGQLYPELRRLEQGGLIEGVSLPRGGRARKEFRLTGAGQTALRAWLREPQVVYELRDEGLLKLFFADALDRDDALALLRALRLQRQGVLEQLRGIQGRKGRALEGCPGLVLDYGIGMHEWIVDWCERVEQRLAGPPATDTATRKAGER